MIDRLQQLQQQYQSASIAAAIRFAAAEDDDAEARLDDAGSSCEGDEFGALPPASSWMEPEPRQVADTRCARCGEGDDFAFLISGMDEALIAYADRFLGDDQVWNRLKAVRQAMSESL